MFLKPIVKSKIRQIHVRSGIEFPRSFGARRVPDGDEDGVGESLAGAEA